ncbi:MAG: S-layer homology domain-containing protein [Oscillospiraceae bacterium]|nr:S-layer homology domain-containing protein [Oscillospiraceae bacterium]
MPISAFAVAPVVSNIQIREQPNPTVTILSYDLDINSVVYLALYTGTHTAPTTLAEVVAGVGAVKQSGQLSVSAGTNIPLQWSGLTPNTSYTSYIVATADGEESAVVSVPFTTLAAVAPVISNIQIREQPNPTVTILSYDLDINSVVYLALYTGTHTAPTTLAEVVAGVGAVKQSGQLSVSAGTNIPLQWSGLTPNTSYTSYIVATADGEESAVVSVPFTTLAAVAPVVSNVTTDLITQTTVLIYYDLDKASTLYAAIYPGTATLTAAEVKSHVGADWDAHGAVTTAVTGGQINPTGLTPNTSYTAYLVATEAGEDSAVVSVPFTTLAVVTPTYTISATSLTSFGSLQTPFTQPSAQTVTITNTGTEAITLTQPTSTDFIIGTLSTTSLATTGATATFTVQPKAGLAVGVYSETIVISGNNGASATVSAVFTVTSAAPTYTATISPTSRTFTSVTAGYGVQTAQAFTITNTGTGTLTNFAATFTTGTAFEISVALSSYFAVAGNTVTISARPKTGLSASTYTDTLIITGDNGINLTASLSFTVTSGGGSGGGGGGGTSNNTVIEEVEDEEIDDVILPPLTAPFNDVNENDWFAEAVDYVYSAGLMIGVDDNRFSPSGTLTRGMIVTILYRLEGEPSVANLANPFTDVADDVWYTDAIKWGAANDIVLGYGDGRFGPNDPVTKEQLAALIYRTQLATKKLPPDILMDFQWSDWNAISQWARGAVNILTIQGVFRDIEGASFNPRQPATRAEVASILFRWLDSVQ